jgi:hypothetical protein
VPLLVPKGAFGNAEFVAVHRLAVHHVGRSCRSHALGLGLAVSHPQAAAHGVGKHEFVAGKKSTLAGRLGQTNGVGHRVCLALYLHKNIAAVEPETIIGLGVAAQRRQRI